MVKHVILWKLKEELGDKSRQEVLSGIKDNLEALAGKVPDSELENEDELKAYQVHPEHVKAADTYVRPYTETRMCMDYEV